MCCDGAFFSTYGAVDGEFSLGVEGDCDEEKQEGEGPEVSVFHASRLAVSDGAGQVSRWVPRENRRQEARTLRMRSIEMLLPTAMATQSLQLGANDSSGKALLAKNHRVSSTGSSVCHVVITVAPDGSSGARSRSKQS